MYKIDFTELTCECGVKGKIQHRLIIERAEYCGGVVEVEVDADGEIDINGTDPDELWEEDDTFNCKYYHESLFCYACNTEPDYDNIVKASKADILTIHLAGLSD